VCVCVLFEWVEAGVSTVLCAIVSSGDCKLDGGIIASLRVRVGLAEVWMRRKLEGCRGVLGLLGEEEEFEDSRLQKSSKEVSLRVRVLFNYVFEELRSLLDVDVFVVGVGVVGGRRGFCELVTEESYVDGAVKMRASTRRKETRRGLLQVAVPKQDAPISNFL
jgi:hypothetical protein